MEIKTNDTFKPKFAVLGAGHGGLAMAGHLGLMGFDVNLYNRTEDRLWGIKAREGIEVEGEINGFGQVTIATTHIEEAIRGVDIIMVVVPAMGHRFIAEQCAPYLQDGQMVILNPGRTFGALEFREVLEEKNCGANIIIAETQTFIYASRCTGPAQVKIFRIKNSIPVASIRAHRIPDILKKVRCAFPQFIPGDNILKTSFDNIGSVFHPAICLMNAGWIEDISEFQFYIQGVTQSVAKILDQVDAERVAVAAALGIRALTAREWLYLAYNTVGKSLQSAMHANPGYRGIMAPTNLNMRYITEDVPYSLVPIASVGEMLNTPTPTIKALIHFASTIHDCDYWKDGRTVEKLGIAGKSLKEIRLLSIGQSSL